MNRILNYTIVATNTWEAIDFGTLKSVHGMAVQNRSAVDVDVSYVAGQATRWTIKSGTVLARAWNHPMMPQLYVRGTATNVIEIELTTVH